MLSAIVVVLVVCWGVESFPDGAPIDACVRERANQPNHSQHRTQPLSSLPYRVRASGTEYAPNAPITVSIEGAEPFKGFFIQARSVETNQWLGAWENAPNTTIHPECASITHADPVDKVRATLLWRAPPDNHGRVYFTQYNCGDGGCDRSSGQQKFLWYGQEQGTVLKNYGTFWADLIAEVPQDPSRLQILG